MAVLRVAAIRDPVCVNTDLRIVVTGGAGLVGQNLLTRLKQAGFSRLVALDKHEHNLNVLRKLHSDIQCVQADLSSPGDWSGCLDDCDVIVMLHAQIGAKHSQPFEVNNIVATEVVMEEVVRRGVDYIVHASSSVVNSVAEDDYTITKRRQEALVAESSVPHAILRPTLMFGWFDRKHLGWLAQFMRRVPIFPVPGLGRIPRQPLYVGDFCSVIESCIANRITGVYDISGTEFVNYVDMIRAIRSAVGARTAIMPIPFHLFDALLRTWALFDRDPPFTSAQLHALVAADEFEITDWPKRFGVTVTPFRRAIEETFNHPVYSSVELRF